MNNATSNSTSCSSTDVFNKAEAIAWYSAFSLMSLLIVTGNLLTIVLFVIYKKVRKDFFLLVFNMACADLLIGAVSLPVYIYKPKTSIFDAIFSVVCLQVSITFAALISCERLYATCWPLKYRTLSGRPYVQHFPC